MKRDDIILVASTMVVSAIIAAFVSATILSNSKSMNQQVTVVNTISTYFQQPSSKYLNVNSIDPTLLVKIGSNSNTAPFTQ